MECRCKRVLVLHLLLSMSLGLIIMALLIACLVSRCPGSAFSPQMHRQLPVRSLHFDKSLTMQAAHYIFRSISTSTRRTYSSGERHFMRFCLFNNLISSENHFLPARKSTLIHFVTHPANSLSYGTINVYLAAANNLHMIVPWNFPLCHFYLGAIFLENRELQDTRHKISRLVT